MNEETKKKKSKSTHRLMHRETAMQRERQGGKNNERATPQFIRKEITKQLTKSFRTTYIYKNVNLIKFRKPVSSMIWYLLIVW